MLVEVFSDTVCSWCYIGKRRFESALELLGTSGVEIIWRPYMLYPDVPKEGVPRHPYLQKRFGDRTAEMFDHIAKEGLEDGIVFAFDEITIQPNTFDSHRLVEYAHWQGKGNDIMELLFDAYLVKARDIGSRDILLDVAHSGGLDVTETSRILDSNAFANEVAAGLQRVQALEIGAVPCFRINNSIHMEGAQTPETIAEVVRRYGDRAVGGRKSKSSRSRDRLH